MAKVKTAAPRTSRPAADNDVYTVLLLTATLFLLLALIYVGYRTQVLFGSLMPPPGF